MATEENGTRQPADRSFRHDLSTTTDSDGVPGYIRLADGSELNIEMLDLAHDGCKIRLATTLDAGEEVALSVADILDVPAVIRRYSDGIANLSFRPSSATEVDKIPRAHERLPLKATLLLRRAGHKNYAVESQDVSPSGCSVDFVDRPCVGERHWVKFAGLEALEAEVRWVKGYKAGLQFLHPIHPAVFDLLVSRLR